MCSSGVMARDRVLAELAGLGPAPADAFRPGAADPVALLGQVRDLAVFADRVQGQLARLTGVLDAVQGASEAGYSSVAAFLRHACGRSPGRAGELAAVGRGLCRLEAAGTALMAGEISFDAAHVICRAMAQISDEAMTKAAEQQMLALARTQPPTPPAQGQSPGASKPEPDGGQPSPDDGQPGPDGGPPGRGGGPPGPDAGQPGAARGETDPGGEPAPDAAGSGPAFSWPVPGLDPTQLRTVGEDLIYRADPERAEERERRRFERRHLSFGFTAEDTGTLHGSCGDTLSLEIIKTAVHTFGPPLGTEDLRTAAQRRMDGLTAACQAALDSGAAGTRHGAAPHLSILAEEQTLARTRTSAGPTTTSSAPGSATASPAGTGPDETPPRGTTCPSGTPGAPGPDTTGPPGRDLIGSPRLATYSLPRLRTPSPSGPAGPLSGPPPARTGYGAMLTARQVLALACRAEISLIHCRDGIPLDVGRRYRTETPALRRALEARDRGCRFPGCTLPAVWATAHHLVPWANGGETSLTNTALFCFVHHIYYIHLLGWTITGNPNGTLTFTHPGGWLTLESPLPIR